MIRPSTKQLLDELLKVSTPEEKLWISGYMNGLLSQPRIAESGLQKLTVLYGTETGNAKRVALRFIAAAKKKQIPVKLVDTAQYNISELSKEDHLLVIISTQGEGEPPVTARKFYDDLMQSTVDLSSLHFAVFALGDSAYPLFCKTGADVDTKLVQLGAQRILPLQTCDVDIEQPAADWTNAVLNKLHPSPTDATAAKPAVLQKSSREIIEGRIKVSVNLHDKGSDQQTYHIEIATEGALDYEPGDSIAIVPSNKKEVVAEILALAKTQADQHVKTAKFEGQLEELLTHKLNICYLLGSSIKKYGEITGQQLPETRMDLIDLLRKYPIGSAEQFIKFAETLHPIAPRLYSIASTASVTPSEVHLTVSRRRFVKEDEQHFGLCSSFLGELPLGSVIHFYIHRNKHFRLPASDKDIIMVGPGTGIASFRAFLAERDHQAAPGKNWLFFGEKDFVRDFLYQNEVQQYVQTGVLHKVNLAFERNHPKTSRVEDDLRAQGPEVFQWLEKGAYFYLSGLKEPLNAQVDQALQEIVQHYGQKTAEEAKAYIETLKKENRYHKDVY
ncbi:MAG: flavodoxin domain-containing protein [Chitinophagaceae bacterium]